MTEKTIKIISTVGASLFSNYNDPEVQEAIKKGGNPPAGIYTYYQRLLQGDTLLPREISIIRNRIKEYFLWHMEQTNLTSSRKQWQFNANYQQLNRYASAELQSITEIIDQPQYQDNAFQLYFLTTETSVSELAAKLIGEALEEHYQRKNRNVSVIPVPVPGLQVKDRERFQQEGFQELFSAIQNIGSQEPKSATVLLNITGGYKGVVPILTIIGQLFDYPLYYLYEFAKSNSDNEVLLQIPSLPIQFDWSLIEIWQPYLAKNQLSSGLTQADREIITAQLIPANLFQVGPSGAYIRTTLGHIFHTYIETRTPHGRSVLGYLMEYKFYECWLDEKPANMEVQRSMYVDGIEIDLLFTKDGRDKINNRTWGEVKSYKQISYAYAKQSGSKPSYGYRLCTGQKMNFVE